MKKLFFLLFLIISSTFAALAGGKLTGKITDQNNEIIIGAAVMIDGTSLVITSDLDGLFLFRDIAPGKYTVTVTSLGFEKKVIHNVEIKEGGVTPLNVILSTSVMDIVEVTTEASKQSVTSLVLMQQKSINSVDGVSADQIRSTPAKTTGEVLRKISGATIQDNKFVIVRGLADRYNTYLINGMPLPTTEPDKKAFSFDIFPSNMLDNLLIFKTATPDLPGDFAGGVVQVNTRDIPDSKFLTVTAGTGYNTISTFKPYQVGFAKGKKDWMGMDDGTRNLPTDFPGMEKMKELLSNPETRDEASKYLHNDWGTRTYNSSPVSQSYQLSFGNNYTVGKNSLGVLGSLTYNNSRRRFGIERNDYDTDTARIYSYNDEQYKQTILSGGMLNISYKLGDKNKISWKNICTVNGEESVTDRNGVHYANDYYVKAITQQFVSTVLLSSQLSGEHYFDKSKIRLKWGGSLNNTHRNMPNLKRLQYTRNITPAYPEDTLFSASVQPGSPQPNYSGKFYSDLYDKLYTGNADVSMPFNLFGKKHTVRAGMLEQYKTREFDARVFGYVIANPAQFNWALLSSAPDTIFSAGHIGASGFRLKESTNPSDSYTASSSTLAGYVMFDNSITDKLRAVWGARYENYHLALNSREYSGDTISIDTTFTDLLPSVNLIYAVNDKSNLRAAFSQTVARAEFRELAPFSFFDFNSYCAVIGNDTLVPTNIYNYDLRYELFPGYNQMLSLSAFYKDFRNPIENIAFFGGAGSLSRSYQNVKRAVDYGLELEYRFKLSVIDSLLDTKCFGDLTFSSNIAFIRSEVDLSGTKGIDAGSTSRPLQGQSPYIMNAGLQYANIKCGTGFSVMFNRIGKRISEVGTNGYKDIIEAPRSLIDLQFSQKFMKDDKAEVRFTVADLLNAQAMFYQDEDGSGKYEKATDKKITTIKGGTTCSLSLSYSF